MAGLETQRGDAVREFNQTLTLYNRYTAAGEERWKRTRLAGVMVEDRQGQALRHGGAASSSARRTGPVSVGELLAIIPMAGAVGYRPAMEWQLSTPPEGWTLQPGDILLPGDCPLEITASAAELLPWCGRVTVISTILAREQDSLLRHWEVTAR